MTSSNGGLPILPPAFEKRKSEIKNKILQSVKYGEKAVAGLAHDLATMALVAEFSQDAKSSTLTAS